jgi:hypothetical protein
MTTSQIRRTAVAFAMTLVLLEGVAGCAAETSNGSNASDMSCSPANTSRPVPQDPTRPTTKEACDACKGIWAIHGIEPAETCICKTSDVGKDCLDGRDCQGECLIEGTPEFHVMEQGDPPLGYYRGQCAPYDTTFGCFLHIPDGVVNGLPLAPEDASQFICVD